LRSFFHFPEGTYCAEDLLARTLLKYAMKTSAEAAVVCYVSMVHKDI